MHSTWHRQFHFSVKSICDRVINGLNPVRTRCAYNLSLRKPRHACYGRVPKKPGETRCGSRTWTGIASSRVFGARIAVPGVVRGGVRKSGVALRTRGLHRNCQITAFSKLLLPAHKALCEGIVNQVSSSLQPKFLVYPLAIRLHGFLAYLQFPRNLPSCKAQCNRT